MTDTDFVTWGTPVSKGLMMYDSEFAGGKWVPAVISGDLALSGLGNATIQANSVALGTDTTGDYVNGVTPGGGLTKTGTEGATLGLTVCADGQIKKYQASAWQCAEDTVAAEDYSIVASNYYNPGTSATISATNKTVLANLNPGAGTVTFNLPDIDSTTTYQVRIGNWIMGSDATHIIAVSPDASDSLYFNVGGEAGNAPAGTSFILDEGTTDSSDAQLAAHVWIECVAYVSANIWICSD
jgi:hypothetical protein